MKRFLAAFSAVVFAASAAVSQTLPLSLNLGTGPNSGRGDSVRDAFAKTQAAVNALNAKIGSQTVPLPGATNLGGVFALSAPSKNFMTGISPNGIPTFAQPNYTDLNGLPTLGTASARNVGNSAGTVAAGDDPRLNINVPSAQLGSQTANPFGAIYPSYLYGIGGSAYYDTKPLATNGLYLPNSTATIQNQYPYGATTTATALTVSTGSNRPGAISGYTAPGQVSAYYENGATAFGINSDSQPVMWSGAGTYSATSFNPTTPITVSNAVFAAVGMWIRSADDPPYNGQVTSWSTDGFGNITQFIVSGWYQINNGVGGAAGTPASGYAYLNPQDKVWSFLPVLNLNSFTTTGNVASGSATITGVINTQGIVAKGQFLSSGALFPAGTYIQSFTANTITVSKPASGTLGTATLKISAGSQMNHGVIAELDLNNNAEPYKWARVTGAATSATGSYVLTSVSNVANLRPYMYVFMNGVPTGTAIVKVDEAASTVTLNAKATATGSVSFIATPSLEEGGTGLDCSSNVADANTCFLARGNQAFSFQSHGAREDAFLLRPNGFAPVPKYGFRVDHSINSTALGVADFAVTDANGTTVWSVDNFGNQISGPLTTAIISYDGAAGSLPGWRLKKAGTQRWSGFLNTDDSFALLNYDATGTLIGTAFQIDNTTGVSKGVTPSNGAVGTELVTAAWSNAKFLPLSGGTVTGAITYNGGNATFNSGATFKGGVGLTGLMGSPPATSLKIRGDDGIYLGASGSTALYIDNTNLTKLQNSPSNAATSTEVVTAAWTIANYLPLSGGTLTSALTAPKVTLTGSSPQLAVSTAAGTYRGMNMQTSGVNRFFCGIDSSAESGANAGSDFYCVRYDDSGTFISNPFSISRKFGTVTIGTSLAIAPFTTAGVVTNSAAGVLSSQAGVSCSSGINTTTFRSVNGVVTAC